MKNIYLFSILVLTFLCSNIFAQTSEIRQVNWFPEPQIEFMPQKYICYKSQNTIIIDGVMDDTDWLNCEWTEEFVDIEGNLQPLPQFATNVKMLWDNNYFYIAAKLEEPHVWATLTEHDSYIYRYNNNFEVFIDPDGDTHEYYEIEENALATVWDLFLDKPYRDGANTYDSWNIDGLLTAVDVQGTINNPSDIDTCWSVELAIPWSVLEEYSNMPTPPENDDQWRVNFSRVQWDFDTTGGVYTQVGSYQNGDENNWVWSPQGLIAMHYPEMWGYVQFSENTVGESIDPFITHDYEDAKWALRKLYYKEKIRKEDYNLAYTDNINILGLESETIDNYTWPPIFEYVNSNSYKAFTYNSDSTIVVDIKQNGDVTVEFLETSSNIKPSSDIVEYFKCTNPVKDYCKLEFFNQSSKNISVLVYSQTGSLVKKSDIRIIENGISIIDMDMMNLNPGCYFIKLVSGKNVYNSKIIKI